MNQRIAAERSRHFDQLHAAAADPWRTETSAYEAAKRADTLRALPHPRVPRILDAGCSSGTLTAALAARARNLVAIDAAPHAVARARARCAHLRHVRIMRADIPPRRWLTPPVDVLVLSEVLYYLSASELARLGRWLRRAVRPGGVIILVCWLGRTEALFTGDQAVRLLARRNRSWLRRMHAARTPQHRRDVFERIHGA